ncbi:MAG: nitroreductase family protein [Acidimicrobiales bacterium]
MSEDRLSMPLGEAIYSLRAIRKLKPDPIPDADLEAILEATIKAPNGGNMQPWHFLAVRDPELRKQFAPLYHEAWWAKRRDSGYHTPEDLPDNYRSAMGLADEIGSAPVLVFICAMAKGAAAANSIIPSAQNLLLAARALGVGGTITTLHPTVEERVHELFEIPETVQIVYCIPLGYPRGRFGPTTRKPLSEVSSYDKWGQRPPE